MSVKAFELVPAIERLQLLGDKAKTSRKPIAQLKAASALTRILVLCDNVLTLLNMFNLEPILSGAKIKGVTSFTVNENPTSSNPFAIEVCVATRKKCIQLYSITEDKMNLMKEVTIPDTPVIMSMDRYCVCVAMATEYCLVDSNTLQVTDLFPYEHETSAPVVKRVGKEEFLLSGPGALGMFVTSAGMSQRPPLKWSESVCGVCYAFPYIVALDDEFLTVHSVLDQQQKQTIPFSGGKILGDYDGKIYIASSKEVYSLVPLPVEKQISALLADKRVEEALTLAKNARKTGLSKEMFRRMYVRIQQQAGFIKLAQYEFEEASQLFKDGALDVRELISLFPNLLPGSTSFNRSLPPLHDFADIKQIVRSDKVKLAECKVFLITFLENVRGTPLTIGMKEDVDTTLMKLYAECDLIKLQKLVSTENSCKLEDSFSILEKNKCHHALATLSRYHGDNESALQIWVKLVDGQLQDNSFPGFDFVIDFMSVLSDHELLWRHVDWALTKDQDKAVKVFTERPATETSSERLRPDDVIAFLHSYPKAVIRYLEFLVFTKNLEQTYRIFTSGLLPHPLPSSSVTHSILDFSSLPPSGNVVSAITTLTNKEAKKIMRVSPCPPYWTLS
ncbi:transforming growth factor-beta receptor-associated protein 1-like [Anneissia japonica]|uniref:transforming growth factor-beta receptor-associated protein 1-like n=1 Tax=Anneissia japonica TaxID=1529436 RepID=UPI0014258BAD|nr:transforming growth factor-beta receptor-associated protein 1-like [Anneissia japonica]